MADDLAITQDRLAFGKILECHFVGLGRVFPQGEAIRKTNSCGQPARVDDDRDVIARVNFNV